MRWTLAAMLAAAAVFVVLSFANQAPLDAAAVCEPSPRNSELARLFSERRSGVLVDGAGTVERLLRDDLDGSRHQRFVLRISAHQTILVSHNIDLAPRIDSLRIGDGVCFRGEYEWNELGGLVHWTHHDPAGRRPGGWLRHAGHTYQ